jgi:hypothetical protein
MPHLSTTGNVIGAKNRICLAETNADIKRKADCLINASFSWPSQFKCNPNSSSHFSSDPVVTDENIEFDQRKVEVTFQYHYLKMYVLDREVY